MFLSKEDKNRRKGLSISIKDSNKRAKINAFENADISHTSILKRAKQDSIRNKSKKETPKLFLKVNKKRTKRKKIMGVLLIIFFFLICGGGYFGYVKVYTPAMRIRTAAIHVKELGNQIAVDFEAKDISNLNTRIDQIQEDLTTINTEIDKFSYLKRLGFTKGYYENLETLNRIIEKSNVLLDDTLPELTEVLTASGFKVDGQVQNLVNTQVVVDTVDATTISSDEKKDPSAINLVLAEMPRYLDLYDRVEPQIISIFDEIKSIDTKYIPNVGSTDIKTKIDKMKLIAEDFPETSKETSDFLRQVPELIGSTGTTTYLLILQNEAEMRASGGLITAYGTLSITDGEVDNITLTDTWNLENYVSADLGIDVGYRNIYGQDVLMNKGCGSTYLRAQDVGIYPDLNWTMNTFSEYYDYANEYDTERFPSYDHIIIADFAFAENFLELIQPLEVEGFGTVTADSLFDFIKADTDDPELSFSPERKRIIEDIANAASEKISKLEVKQVPDLTDVLVNSFMAKDLAFASDDKLLQAYFDEYGMDGRTAQEFYGDYFSLNEAQNCSLKLNKFVRDSVIQDITINADGSITRGINVHWIQDVVYEESMEKQYDITGNFTYRAWIRFLVPEGSTDFETDGYEQSGIIGYFPQEYYDDIMNKEVSDNIIQFNHRRMSEDDPIREHDLNFSYELPSELNYNNTGVYKLLLQKHPGKSWGEKYTINIKQNGATYTTEFILDRDKVLTYANGVIIVENYNTKLDWLQKLVNNLPFGD